VCLAIWVGVYFLVLVKSVLYILMFSPATLILIIWLGSIRAPANDAPSRCACSPFAMRTWTVCGRNKVNRPIRTLSELFTGNAAKNISSGAAKRLIVGIEKQARRRPSRRAFPFYEFLLDERYFSIALRGAVARPPSDASAATARSCCASSNMSL